MMESTAPGSDTANAKIKFMHSKRGGSRSPSPEILVNFYNLATKIYKMFVGSAAICTCT
jgi:hypothetical protein